MSDPQSLPDVPGAYLLLIDIKHLIDLPSRRFAGHTLPSGRYGYAGSAYGPGGIRARCRRHLGRRSTLRWHIDWLTRAAQEVRAVAFPGGTECSLIEALIAQTGASTPIPGFGSSDCRRCPAHLVAFDDGAGSENALLGKLRQLL